MRNTKLYLLVPLFLLSASGASAGIYSYVVGQNTGQSNARYEEQQKARAEGRISCVPQKPTSENLWKCEDAHGNQYEDLVITLKTEVDRIIRKNANAKRTGN
jgi:hypothetical protein